MEAPVTAGSIAAGLEPALEIDQRQRALFGVGLLERAVVELVDPLVVALGAVAREGQPHQAAGGLPRNRVALEQHVAEHRLSLILALVRGEREPARGLPRIARDAVPIEIDARQ